MEGYKSIEMEPAIKHPWGSMQGRACVFLNILDGSPLRNKRFCIYGEQLQDDSKFHSVGNTWMQLKMKAVRRKAVDSVILSFSHQMTLNLVISH